jgi:uncharacterized cofD-like protein
MQTQRKIVTIGGGTGSYTILSAIKNIEDIKISAVVAMTDDGGSTGVLRDELGVLPAGDVRQCLVALSSESDILRKLMSYRFVEGGLSGHNFGNIFLAAIEKITGSFSLGVNEVSKILNIKGSVIPVIDGDAILVAELENGQLVAGENKINHFNFEEKGYGLKKIYIKGNNNLNKLAEEEIVNADYIIICPGNHFCSVLPALVADGVISAFQKSKAKIIYIANLTNKKGHNMNYKLSNFVYDVEKYINKKIDIILNNNEDPTEEQIKYYKIEEGDNVLVQNDMKDDRVINRELLSHKINKFVEGDSLSNMRSFIRHDTEKVKSLVETIINSA